MLETFYRAVLPDQGHYALFLLDGRRHIWTPSIDALTRETEKRVDQQGVYFATGSFAEPTERTTENALHRRAFCFDIDAGPEKYAKHGDKVYKTQRDALAALAAWIKSSGVGPAWILSSGAGLHVYFTLEQPVPVAEWAPVASALKARALFEGLKIDPTVTGDAARILRPPGTLHPSGARVTVLLRSPRTYTLDELRDATAGYAPAQAPRKGSANTIFFEYNGPPRHADKLIRNCAAVGHVAAMRGTVEEPYWRATLGILKHCENGEATAHAISEGYDGYTYAETQKKLDLWTAGPTTCATFEEYNPQACAGCRFRGSYKSPIILGELNDEEVAARAEDATPRRDAVDPAPSAPQGGDSDFGDFGAGSGDDEAPAPRMPAGPWEGHLPENFYIVATPAGHMMMHNKAVQVEDAAADVRADGTRPKKTVSVHTQFAAVPFWIESWSTGEHDGDQALAVYCVFDMHQRCVKRYTLPTKSVANRETLLVALAAQNVQVFPSTPANKQSMEDYVKASLERLRASGQRQKIADRFGTLYRPDGTLAVAQGEHLIAADGSLTVGVVGESLKASARGYRVPLPTEAIGTWARAEWLDNLALPKAREHVAYLREFYSDPNFRPYQLAIMLAWASPMLAFTQGGFMPGMDLPTGIGLTVSLYSPRSGIGKTACMQAAALAFGNPSDLVTQQDSLGSTKLARQERLAHCGTLPSFMDEMEDLEPEELAGLLSTVANGTTRIRIGKNVQITGGRPMSLVNVMSSNKSHREMVAQARGESAATQNRILEIDCSAVQPVSVEVSVREALRRTKVLHCAGAVGAVIHASVVSLGPEKANKLGLNYAHRARDMISSEQQGRFLWRGLGAMLAVRAILRRVDPALDVFDDDELVKEFKHWHDSGSAFTRDRIFPADGPSQLAIFLADVAGHTLITHDMPDGRRKDSKPQIPLNDRVPDDVQVRIALDTGYAFIRTDAVRAWAAHRKVSYRGMVRMCREAGVMDTAYVTSTGGSDLPKFDLRQGTKYATGVRVSAYKVDLRKLDDPTFTRALAEIVPLRPTTEQISEALRTGDHAAG